MIPSFLPKRWRDVPSRVYCDGGLFKSSSLFSASLRRFLISSKSASKHSPHSNSRDLLQPFNESCMTRSLSVWASWGMTPDDRTKMKLFSTLTTLWQTRKFKEITQNDQLQNERLRIKKRYRSLVTQTILKNPQNTGWWKWLMIPKRHTPGWKTLAKRCPAMVALCWSCSFRYPASFSVASATAFNRSHESDLKVDKKSGDLEIFQRCPILGKS